MLDIAEVGLDYDLPALLGGRLHFPLVILNLSEMVVVKNQDGVLNVDALKAAGEKGSRAGRQSGKDRPSRDPRIVPEMICSSMVHLSIFV